MHVYTDGSEKDQERFGKIVLNFQFLWLLGYFNLLKMVGTQMVWLAFGGGD